jgi:hypothetical protein
LNELVVDNSSGVTKAQKDNQFLWQVNYDSISQKTPSNTSVTSTRFSATKLAENIGNSFVQDSNNQISTVSSLFGSNVTSNSLTNILSSEEFNIGYAEKSILSFIGNNNSLLDASKWIDKKPTVASTTKLLTTIHPQIQNLDKIIETNVDKVRSLVGGAENDIDVPINIYFKMNSMDPALDGLNNNYVNLNSVKNTVTHVKKLKFFLENEEQNKPFIFTIKFIINRARVASRRSLTPSTTQLTSNS